MHRGILCIKTGTGGVMKKVAVIVTDRQQEALRMSVGLTLGDSKVSVFIMDSKIEPGEGNDLNLETLGDMDAEIFSNVPESGLTVLSTDEVARKLVEYDAVIPY